MVGDKETTTESFEMQNSDLVMLNRDGWASVTTWFGLTVEFTAQGWYVDVSVPACYEGNISNS